MPRVAVQSPGVDMEDLTDIQSPRRPRRSVAPLPGSMVEGRRSSSARTGSALLPDLAEDLEGETRVEEEVFGDENEEVLTKGGPAQLGEEQDAMGREVFGAFGFRTPRKGAQAMRERAAEAMNRTPLSQRCTPQRAQTTPKGKTTPFSTPTKSNSGTPVKGILKTPTSQRKRRVEPDTPASTRKRVKKTLIRIAEEAETREMSEGSSEEEGEGSQEEEEGPAPVLRGPPATPATPARRGRPRAAPRELDTDSMADSYFTAHSSKVLTSDRTLSKLATPRLSATEVSSLVDSASLQYGDAIHELLQDHATNFPKWLSLLHRGFNIVTYGLGSKKSLLHDFHEKFLLERDTVVVNGFFPSLTIKSIVSHIWEEVLEMEGGAASVAEQAAEVVAAMDGEEEHVYLIVHNIDGATLRNERSQDVLAQLAAHPRIHLVCSIDHINAPLIWDQRRLAKLNFVWFDCTTFLPYREEISSTNSMMTRSSGGLQLASLSSVWPSLTPNAKKVFLVIGRHQQAASEGPDYPGLSFMDLYRLARAEFLVASDLALRAQLTEFRDHQLVLSKRSGGDGGEYLTIPLDRATLQAFMESVEEA